MSPPGTGSGNIARRSVDTTGSGSPPVGSRITSYNVCYTKLLRSHEKVTDPLASAGRTRSLATRASLPVARNWFEFAYGLFEPAEPEGAFESTAEEGEHVRETVEVASPDSLAQAIAAHPLARTIELRITSYNVCYTKLLRTTRSSPA